MRYDFIGMGYQFHKLVSNSITEMLKQGNRTYILSAPLKDGEYKEMTKWNDFNIGIPLLFNFYHGMELIMKGVLQEKKVVFKPNHSISSLLKELEHAQIELPKPLTKLFRKYISNSHQFSTVFTENGITSDKYHLLLKYPVNKKERHKHSSIRGKEKPGFENFRILKDDIDLIEQEIIHWFAIKNGLKK